MKTLILVSLAIGLFVVGCGDNSSKSASSTNSATGGTLVTAPVDYLDTVAKAKQRAVKTIDTASLDKAIQMFNVQKGRNPKDLNELVTEKYISEIPAAPYGQKIEYDANSGTVSVVKQ
jgi:ABC-type Fe3+-hydroxamate transport system substrate-binding protein